MSTTTKKSKITTQLQRPVEYYQKLEADVDYDDDVYIKRPPTLRIIPYRPGRQQWNGESSRKPWNPYGRYRYYGDPDSEDDDDDDNVDVDDDDEPPRLDGKSKSLLKRLNKSDNSVFSKKWTQDRNKARQVVRLHRLEPVLA